MAIGIGLGLSFARRRRGGSVLPSPIFITPAAAVATGSAVDPTVVADVFITPAAAIAMGEVEAPQANGDIVINPSVAAAIASAFAPTVVADVNVTPPAANATASAVAPSILSNAIPAVVYDGFQGNLLHTGGPAGAADGDALTVVWAGTFNSDGSVHTLLDIPGTVPVKLYRDSDNTIVYRGGTGGAVFNCSTSAVAASLGFLIILASCSGTDAEIRVIHAAGTISSSNSPGSAADLDLTADWYFGCAAGAASEFLDADAAIWWTHNIALDLTDADNIEQFWDTTADLLRDPGADGSNPVDGAFSPLVCHQAAAASHAVNSGTGGDADTAGTFTDGTSPGTYAGDFVGTDPALAILATFDAWWEFDDVGNTITSGAVETLADKTANAQDPTQGTAGNRPAFSTNYGDFDGGDDWLGITTPSTFMQHPWTSPGGTCFVVFSADSDGGGDLGAIWDHGLSEAIRTIGQVGSDITIQIQGRYQLNQGIVNITAALPISTVHVLVVRWNKSSGTAGVTCNVNGPTNLTVASAGLTEITANTGSVNNPSTNFRIGSRVAGATQTYDGKMFAMAWKAGLMSDGDVATVGEYLATKYSGTWA